MAAVTLGPKYTTHCEYVNLRWSSDRLHRVPGCNGLVLVDIWLPMFASARTRVIMCARSHDSTGIGQRVRIAQASVPLVFFRWDVRAAPAPLDSASLTSFQSVLQRLRSDPDQKPISADANVWSSDLDGSPGTGQGVTVRGLSPGIHTITVSVVDADGQTASDSVLGLVDTESVYLSLVLHTT